MSGRKYNTVYDDDYTNFKTSSTNGNQHFNAEKTIEKYSLDVSTFDVIKLSDFHNYKCSTICWYLYMWILVFLSIALLSVDIYSCLNILVFHRWATDNYKPFAYPVAKWIFTGCIIFQFCLLLYHWIWAIHTYKTKNIALVYLNSISKKLYSIKSYYYFCLLNSIDEGEFFEWCCFLTYYELDNALQILIADTPRQVINVLTLRYYATGGDLNNAILKNIQQIAKTNLYLSIILSFMCLSVFIYAIFLFRFLFGMIMYTPIKCSISETKYNTLKKYCIHLINKSVSNAVNLHHKSKRELFEQGILSESRIENLPNFSSASLMKSYSTISLDNLTRRPTDQSLSRFDDYEKQQIHDTTITNRLNENVTKPYQDLPNYKTRQPSTSNLLGNEKPIRKPPQSYNQSYNQSFQRSVSEQPHPSKLPSRSFPNDSVESNQRMVSEQQQSSKLPSRSYTDHSIESSVQNPFEEPVSNPFTTQYDNEKGQHDSLFKKDNNSTSSLDFVTSLSESNTYSQPKRVFTDEYPITKEEKKNKMNELHNKVSVDNLQILDTYNTNESNDSIPYPVRGVSKYFDD